MSVSPRLHNQPPHDGHISHATRGKREVNIPLMQSPRIITLNRQYPLYNPMPSHSPIHDVVGSAKKQLCRFRAIPLQQMPCSSRGKEVWGAHSRKAHQGGRALTSKEDEWAPVLGASCLLPTAYGFGDVEALAGRTDHMLLIGFGWAVAIPNLPSSCECLWRKINPSCTGCEVVNLATFGHAIRQELIMYAIVLLRAFRDRDRFYVTAGHDT
jgi:hypothetical protein